MNDTATVYYERYWERPGEAPPERDPTTPLRLKLLWRALGETAGLQILDVGCGTGFFVTQFEQKGHRAVGADISTRAIAEARRRYPSKDFQVLAPGQNYPFPDGAFDVVFSTEVIEHLLDLPTVLCEWNRVLKPGGQLILTTPYHGLFKNLLLVLLWFDRHFDVLGPHIRFFSKRAMRRCLERFGFRMTSNQCLGRMWPVAKGMFVSAVKMHAPKPENVSR